MFQETHKQRDLQHDLLLLPARLLPLLRLPTAGVSRALSQGLVLGAQELKHFRILPEAQIVQIDVAIENLHVQ